MSVVNRCFVAVVLDMTIIFRIILH